MRLILPFSLFLLFSCSSSQNEFVSMEEFEKYLNDPENGYIQSDEAGDLFFEAKLNPPLSDDPNPQFAIQLRISRLDGKPVLETNTKSGAEVLEREGYLSFDLAKDVAVEYDGKAVSCVFHHYERNYGLKPSIDVFFQFPAIKEPKENPVFVYRDQQFGEGLIKIEFDKELFTTCYVKK
jgi:hypothetical protein